MVDISLYAIAGALREPKENWQKQPSFTFAIHAHESAVQARDERVNGHIPVAVWDQRSRMRSIALLLIVFGCDGGATANEADLSVQITGQPTIAGAPATFAISAQNAGPGDVRDAIISGVLPTGTTLVEVTSADAECELVEPTPPAMTTVVNCARPEFASGDLAQVEFTVTTPSSGGRLVAAAEVNAQILDPDLANNTAETAIDLTASADLGVVVTDAEIR